MVGQRPAIFPPKKTTMQPPLFIIDASGYLYRSYHAIQNMTNNKGESTNALFGFIRSLLKLQNDFNPTHMVAVFDGPDNIKKRKAIYPEYKAQRVAMPQDLRHQIDWAKEYCRLMNIPLLCIPEVEADDTMGSLAVQLTDTFNPVYLCTSDKDMAQLVHNGVKILNTHKENLILGEKEVEEVYGVPPKQIIDFLSITGDSSDNVPGLPGFGPKTAVALLKEMGSLDNILNNPDKVPGKKKQETIVQEREKALISRQLVTIDDAVEVPHETAFYAIGEGDYEGLKEFYTEKSFNTMLKELEQSSGKPAVEEKVDYILVDDALELEKLIKHLSTQKEICFDTETTAIEPLRAELVGIGFCVEETQAWYIPVNGNISLETVLKAVKPLFENSAIGFYGHNVKYDLHIMENYGITVANICFDTIIASYLLNAHNRQHNLDALSLQYFSKLKTPTSDLLGKGRAAITMDQVPIRRVCDYCCEDADYTCRLKLLLEKQLKERKLTPLFKDLEMPLMRVLARMERHGIFLDIPILEGMGAKIAIMLKALEADIYALAGQEFNINSPKQVSDILFTKLGLSAPKKTATGLSTNAEVLEELKGQHPIAEKLLEYRMLEKLRSTYLETLLEEVNPKTHRIHPTFNQVVAATGRLSCQNPNLQNIPTRTEIGRDIRQAFRPEKQGWSYLSADYSQIELRLVAHFSEDPNLIKAFQQGEDIHARTAATVFGVPIDKVTSEMRHRAKAVNFGIIYGQQAYGLARELGIGVKDAQNFIDTYFQQFPNIKEYLEKCRASARESGKAVTYMGRERSIPEINNKNPTIRNEAERLSINTPLQGSAADLIKAAMLKIDSTFKKDGNLGYMILQIHDELIFELPDFEIPTTEIIVKGIMESAFKLKVPLVVNIKVGKNWKEC